MATRQEATEPGLRDIYPEFPPTVSAYLQKAGQGDPTALEALSVVGDMATFVDPWHREAVRGIFDTRHPVTDREKLLETTLGALTTIKGQVQEGEPYLYGLGGTYYAGVLGDPDEITNYTKYPGLSLNVVGTTVCRSSGGFPAFGVRRDSEQNIGLYFDRPHNQHAWDHLPGIARGVGYVAFGRENIARNMAQRTGDTQFAAALALKAAEIDIDVQLDAELLEIARKESIEAISAAAAGTESNDLQKQPRRDVRLLLDLVGLSQGDVLQRSQELLQEAIADPTSSLTHTAQALSGKLVVEQLVASLFADE